MGKIYPLSKILLPIDGSDNSLRAVRFAGYLGSALKDDLLNVNILRVITGGFISQHLSYIDLMADVVGETDTFKKIKEEHIDKNIKPALEEAEKILKNLGVKAEIEKVVAEGDAAKKIIEIAEKKQCQTIIMAKRGISEIEGFFLGSVTNKVIHSVKNQSVYIIGQKIHEVSECPLPEILIPIDGSRYSLKGVELAACLASKLGSVRKIALLRVINLAVIMERLQGGIEPLEEANKIFEEAKKILLNAGISENIIQPLIKVGIPAEEILREVDRGNYSMIIIGRKGRSSLKDYVLGSVSSIVIERSKNPTIAIVNND
ncbi:MAG: universal stress protein [Nitrospirae bacterium]|nr:universal stress protein [Nitrospirota bacterium]